MFAKAPSSKKFELPDKEEAKNVYAFTVDDLKHNPVSLSQYKGKVLIITNVAALWGATKVNYEGLQRLYNKYKDRGLEILGFPCDQFLGQMGDTDACALRFQADFPHFAQVDVNGSNAHPLFRYLKNSVAGSSWLFSSAITWNFEKFLVNRDGVPVSRFAKADGYDKVEAALVELLDKPGSS